MNKHIGLVVIIILACYRLAMGQDIPPLSVNSSDSVPPPLILKDGQIISDSTHYALPQPPKRMDGTSVDLINDTDTTPQGMALVDLTENQTLAQIPLVNKNDSKSNYYYWHPFMGWNFVHYRDGNQQWYGWHTGEAFHWVLWKSGRFWWYDNYAGRWLYYYQGLWWWQSLKKPLQIQVFMNDGHFHLCDKNGVLGEDLMRTGIEEDFTTEPSDSTSDSDDNNSGHHHGGQIGGASLDNPADTNDVPPSDMGDE